MSRRTAEQYMQAFAKFGTNPDIARLGTTKVLKLLPLPEEDREALMAANDVSSMSTRQLDEAIREQKAKLMEEARAEAKAEAKNEIERERNARLAAEERAQAAENRPPEVPQDVQEALQESQKIIEQQKAEIEKLGNADNDHSESLMKKIKQLESDVAERDEMLEDQQAEYNRMQSELLNMKSTLARGDAERLPVDQLTPDVFASAVRAFVGAVARMPQMGATFASMDSNDRAEYDELLRTVENWAEGSRRALNSVVFEGVAYDD